MRAVSTGSRILVLMATLALGIRAASPATASLRALVETSEQRLQIARKVALAKWYSKTPVEDPFREALVIAKAAKDASTAGLPPIQAEQFFKAQIEANKLVQYAL